MFLCESGTIRNALLRLRENHFAALKYKAGYQKLRHEGADLFRREIDDADNLTPEEICFGIKFGHLGAGFHYAEITKIRPDFIRWGFGLRKIFHPADRAGAYFNFFKILPRYRFHPQTPFRARWCRCDK